MVVGAKVCDLTEDLLWFVCGNFDVFPYLGSPIMLMLLRTNLFLVGRRFMRTSRE